MQEPHHQRCSPQAPLLTRWNGIPAAVQWHRVALLWLLLLLGLGHQVQKARCLLQWLCLGSEPQAQQLRLVQLGLPLQPQHLCHQQQQQQQQGL